MRAFTLAQVRTKVRQRADMVNSQFVTDDELNGYISASYAELYDILMKSGLHQIETAQTVNTDGSELYALPADYYATLGVEYKYDATHFLSLPLVEFAEKNRYVNLQPFGYSVGYRTVGGAGTPGSLVLLPTPPVGQVYRHWYIPAAVDLTTDGQTIDGVNGWEEYIVVDAAIKCLTKEESDTSALRGERQRLMERVEESAETRSMVPHRVTDVYRGYGDDPWWPWWGGGGR